jgi:hypothetical protein
VAGTPEDEGVDSGTIVALTEWIRDQRVPIFSFLSSTRSSTAWARRDCCCS